MAFYCLKVTFICAAIPPSFSLKHWQYSEWLRALKALRCLLVWGQNKMNCRAEPRHAILAQSQPLVCEAAPFSLWSGHSILVSVHCALATALLPEQHMNVQSCTFWIKFSSVHIHKRAGTESEVRSVIDIFKYIFWIFFSLYTLKCKWQGFPSAERLMVLNHACTSGNLKSRKVPLFLWKWFCPLAHSCGESCVWVHLKSPALLSAEQVQRGESSDFPEG